MKVWFFVHCGSEKNQNRILFCSSTPLVRSGRTYDFDTNSNFDSFMLVYSQDEELYDYILDKVELFNPTDTTQVWEADL